MRLLWNMVVDYFKSFDFQNNLSSLLYPETDSEHHSTVHLQLFLHGPCTFGVPSPTDHGDHCKSRVNAGTTPIKHKKPRHTRFLMTIAIKGILAST